MIRQFFKSAFALYEELYRFGGCYSPLAAASVDNTLLDLHNSSYDAKAEFSNN